MTYRVTALGMMLSALLGGATLPPQHKLFSPNVETSLRGLQITASTPKDNFVVPAEFTKSRAFTLANMKSSSGILECVNKAADAMKVEESGTHLMLSFSCQGGILSSQVGVKGTPGNQSLVVAYDKAAVPTLFNSTSGVRIVRSRLFENQPSRAAVKQGLSKDELELKGCVDAFQAYKSQPSTGYFRVSFVKRVYHCDSGRSRELYMAHKYNLASKNPLSLSGAAGNSLPPMLYIQSRIVVPDQHPPIQTQFDPATFIAYNSKPDPFANTKGAIHLKRPIEATVVKLAIGMDAPLGWVDAAIQIGSQRLDTVPLFAAGKPVDPCQGWQTPPGLLGTVAGGAVPRDNNPPVMGSPLEKVRQIANLDLAISELEDLAKKTGAADQQFYIRVVPLNAAHGCAASPSNSVVVHLHDNYPQEQAEYNQIVAENKAKAAFSANDGKAGAPLNVSISTYVPWNLDDDNMLNVPSQILETRVTSDQMNVFGIKHGGEWDPGCAFEPAQVLTWGETNHAGLDSAAETAWDDILEGVELLLIEYNSLFQSAAEFLVYIGTAGKCPIDDPTGITPPPANEDNGCVFSKKFIASVIKLAFSYVTGGLSIASSASSLVAQGITEATNAAVEAGEQAAQELISAEIAPMLEDLSQDAYYQLAVSLVEYGLQEGAKAGIDALGQFLTKKLTTTLTCNDTTASGALYPHKNLEDALLKFVTTNSTASPTYAAGYAALIAQFTAVAQKDDAFASALKTYPPGSYAFDEKLCVVTWGGNPETWGKANPARLNSTGLVYLRVTRNTSAPALRAAALKPNAQMTIYVTDKNGWYHDAYVRLSLSKIPAHGLTVPLMLTPNVEKYQEKARLNQGYPAVYDVDLEQALWMQGRLHDPNPQSEFVVTGSYQWTDQLFTWNGNRLPVTWDRHTLPLNQNFNLKLPASPGVCTFCDKGDGSYQFCNSK